MSPHFRTPAWAAVPLLLALQLAVSAALFHLGEWLPFLPLGLGWANVLGLAGGAALFAAAFGRRQGGWNRRSRRKLAFFATGAHLALAAGFFTRHPGQWTGAAWGSRRDWLMLIFVLPLAAMLAWGLTWWGLRWGSRPAGPSQNRFPEDRT